MTQLVIIFWDLGIGGVQTRIQGLVKKIIQQHQDVTVTLLLYERRANEVSLPKHPRVKIKTFPGPKKFTWFGVKKKFWRFTTAQFAWWLFRELWNNKPARMMTFLNRITTYVMPYVLLSKFMNFKTKLIINEPVVMSRYLSQYDPRIWHWITVANYRLADKIIVAAQAVKQDLVRNFFASAKK